MKPKKRYGNNFYNPPPPPHQNGCCHKTKDNADIGPFFNKDGNPVLQSEEIVSMLKDQYESVFSFPKEEFKIDDPATFFSNYDSPNQLDNVPFDWQDVVDVIDSLSASAAAGPDGVSAILLKKMQTQPEGWTSRSVPEVP